MRFQRVGGVNSRKCSTLAALIVRSQARTPAMQTVVMRSDIPMVEHRRNLDEALRLMQEKRLPAVGVGDGAGRLIGFVTPENIGEMMMIQAARPERRAGAPWRPEPPRTSV